MITDRRRHVTTAAVRSPASMISKASISLLTAVNGAIMHRPRPRTRDGSSMADGASACWPPGAQLVLAAPFAGSAFMATSALGRMHGTVVKPEGAGMNLLARHRVLWD